MGICISCSPSQKIQDGNENAMFCSKNIDFFVDQTLGSIYSKAGSKGLNQDNAIICKGYGVGGATFYGVFDGHGKNGHMVSEMVKNLVPSLLQSQIEALEHVTLLTESDDQQNRNDHLDSAAESSKNFEKWEAAVLNAFRVMDKEIKLQQDLDLSCSGTTAAVIRQGEDI